jgi:hypothetical protein
LSCLALLLVVSVRTVQGQAVIDAAGGEATGSGGTTSYSVGQIVYYSNSEAGGSENQGVQQPYEFTALPVTLVYFEVKSENEQVQVRWETAAEKNNDFFTVERSINSVAFEEVANITALGNSNSNRKYNWTDVHPHTGISYYRLKQTDLDKSYTYSRIRAVRIKSLSGQIETYPNPVSDYLILKDDTEGHSRSYKIFDLNGRLIESGGLSEGERKIDMTHLSPEIYLIHYMNGSEVQKIKIIKN